MKSDLSHSWKYQDDDKWFHVDRNVYIVKVTLNLSLLRCMLFANYSRNFHPIVMKFGKHYFLVLRQLP